MPTQGPNSMPPEMMAMIRDDLALLGVTMDVFFSEKSLYGTGRIEAALAALESFEDANRTLDGIADVDPQVRARVAGLADLARVGAHLLEAIPQGESVDALPLKTFGALR